jgi:replicative DNA helicase
MNSISSGTVNSLPTRQPPHNIELEQALLGGLLVDPTVYERIDIKPDHFYDPLHAAIFETMTQLFAANRPVSPSTLRTFFENAEPIDTDLTVPEYIWRLTEGAVTTVSAAEYARSIRDLATRRHLIHISEQVIEDSYENPLDYPVERQITDVESALFALAESGSQKAYETSLRDAVDRAIESINAAHQRGGKLQGLTTGLMDLDNMMGGLQPSDLIILAGRPSMGKTALATNIAVNVANSAPENNGGPVGFFSLEMSDGQLAMRILASDVGISGESLRRGKVTDAEMARLMQSGRRVGAAPIRIDRTGGISIAQLAARARRMKRKHGIVLFIVDYLQLMQASGRGSGNRVQDVTEITTGLKALAKELDTPIIALSQLSRAVEQRPDKRPQLSDLRESGSIEQDADVVLFVYREEYYVQREEPPIADMMKYVDWQERMKSVTGKGEVIIGKHRHGPTGVVSVHFDGARTQFSNLARKEQVAA